MEARAKYFELPINGLEVITGLELSIPVFLDPTNILEILT